MSSFATHSPVIFLSNCVTVLGAYYFNSIHEKWKRIVSSSSWSWYICLTVWISWHIATDLICASSIYGGDLLTYLELMIKFSSM